LLCGLCRHAVLLPRTKFCRNRTIGRWVMAKKEIFKMAVAPSWIPKKSIFGHVTVTGFNIWCSVPNFIKIGRFFTEIWRFNDFQNGGRPISWILKNCSFCHLALVDMPFCFLIQNFAEIGQSVDELWPKSDFQDGGRRHLEFQKLRFLVTWLSLGSISAAVYQILSKSDNFSLRYGDLAVFKMAAVRHLGFVYDVTVLHRRKHFRCANIVLKFLVDRCCSFRDICNIIRQPFGCT